MQAQELSQGGTGQGSTTRAGAENAESRTHGVEFQQRHNAGEGGFGSEWLTGNTYGEDEF